MRSSNTGISGVMYYLLSEEKAWTPMTHYVQHFLRSGDYVQTEFTCTAREGASCRMVCQTCSDECREACECGSFNEDGDERTPEMVDYGECMQILWLTQDAPEECFNGDEQPVRGPEPQAITLEWNGDNYDWDYE